MTSENSLVRLERAAKSGGLSEQSLQVFKRVADKSGSTRADNQRGYHIDPALVRGRHIMYVTLVPDDSGSMNTEVREVPNIKPSDARGLVRYTPSHVAAGLVPFAGERLEIAGKTYITRPVSGSDPRSNSEATRQGHNRALGIIRAVPYDGTILIATRTINNAVINSGVPVADAAPLTQENFMPHAGTPLFEGTINALQDVLEKERMFRDMWARSFSSATLVMTDGGSTDFAVTAADVATVVTDMNTRGRHILAGYGIPDGFTDLNAQWAAMGIAEELRLHAGSSSEEIQKALGLWAELIKRAALPNGFKAAREGGFKALQAPK